MGAPGQGVSMSGAAVNLTQLWAGTGTFTTSIATNEYTSSVQGFSGVYNSYAPLVLQPMGGGNVSFSGQNITGAANAYLSGAVNANSAVVNTLTASGTGATIGLGNTQITAGGLSLLMQNALTFAATNSGGLTVSVASDSSGVFNVYGGTKLQNGLQGTTGSFSGALSVGSITGGSASLTNLTTSSITGTNAGLTYLNVSSLTGTNASLTNLTTSSLTGTNAAFTSLTGTNLTLSGSLTGTSIYALTGSYTNLATQNLTGSFISSTNALITGALTGGSAAFTSMTGGSAYYSGTLTTTGQVSAGSFTGTSGTFSTGVSAPSFSGTNLYLSNLLQAAGVNSSGNVSGTNGLFSGGVSGTSLTTSGTVSGGSFTGTNAYYSGTLTSAGKLTAGSPATTNNLYGTTQVGTLNVSTALNATTSTTTLNTVGAQSVQTTLLTAGTGTFVQLYSTKSDGTTIRNTLDDSFGNAYISGALTGTSIGSTSTTITTPAVSNNAPLLVFAPNLSMNQPVSMFIGTSAQTGAYLGFQNIAPGSTGNYLFMQAGSNKLKVGANNSVSTNNITLDDGAGNLNFLTANPSISASSLTINAPLSLSLTGAGSSFSDFNVIKPGLGSGQYATVNVGQNYGVVNGSGQLSYLYNSNGTGSSFKMGMVSGPNAITINGQGQIGTSYNTLDGGTGQMTTSGLLTANGGISTSTLSTSGSVVVPYLIANNTPTNPAYTALVAGVKSSVPTLTAVSNGATLTTLQLSGTSVKANNNTMDDGSGNVSINSTNNGTGNTPLPVLYSALPVNQSTYVQVGKALGQYQAAALGFSYYSSTTGANNAATLSVNGGPALYVNGAGKVSTPGNNILDDGNGNLTVLGQLTVGGNISSTLYNGNISVGTTGSNNAGVALLGQNSTWQMYNHGSTGTSPNVNNFLGFYNNQQNTTVLKLTQTSGVSTANTTLDDGSGNMIFSSAGIHCASNLYTNIYPTTGGQIGFTNAGRTLWGLRVNDNGANAPSTYTSNNTLDDGNGGMSIGGGLTGGSSAIFNGPVWGQKYTALAWNPTQGCQIYDSYNGKQWLYQNGTTPGYVRTLNGTILDDGSGNMTVNSVNNGGFVGSFFQANATGAASTALLVGRGATSASGAIFGYAGAGTVIGSNTTTSPVAYMSLYNKPVFLYGDQLGAVYTQKNVLDDGNGNLTVNGTVQSKFLTASTNSATPNYPLLSVGQSNSAATGSAILAQFVQGWLGSGQTASLTVGQQNSNFYTSLGYTYGSNVASLGVFGGTQSLSVGTSTVGTKYNVLDDGTGRMTLGLTGTGSTFADFNVLKPNLANGSLCTMNIGTGLTTNGAAQLSYVQGTTGAGSLQFGLLNGTALITMTSAGVIRTTNNVLDDGGNMSTSSLSTGTAVIASHFAGQLATGNTVKVQFGQSNLTNSGGQLTYVNNNSGTGTAVGFGMIGGNSLNVNANGRIASVNSSNQVQNMLDDGAGNMSCTGTSTIGLTQISSTATASTAISLPSTAGTLALRTNYLVMGSASLTLTGGGVVQLSNTALYGSLGVSYTLTTITLPIGTYSIHMNGYFGVVGSSTGTLTASGSSSNVVVSGGVATIQNNSGTAQSLSMNLLCVVSVLVAGSVSFQTANITSPMIGGSLAVRQLV